MRTRHLFAITALAALPLSLAACTPPEEPTAPKETYFQELSDAKPGEFRIQRFVNAQSKAPVERITLIVKAGTETKDGKTCGKFKVIAGKAQGNSISVQYGTRVIGAINTVTGMPKSFNTLVDYQPADTSKLLDTPAERGQAKLSVSDTIYCPK